MAAQTNEFYIIVNKDASNKLIIIEEINIANFVTDKSPNAIITGADSGYFKVKVIPGEDGGIDVNGKKYKLVLEQPYNGTGTQILSSATFAQAAATATATVDDAAATATVNDAAATATVDDAAATGAVDADATTVDANATGTNKGGKKDQHYKHNKRSYSKKNRKSRSKSDTLRNYFNYSAIETM